VATVEELEARILKLEDKILMQEWEDRIRKLEEKVFMQDKIITDFFDCRSTVDESTFRSETVSVIEPDGRKESTK
jgi:uncharacterized coiled-coil protein SlyX